MNDELYDHISELKNLFIKKIKKGTFTIQENNITFKIKICRDPICPFCLKVSGSNILKCKHILFVLVEYYGLSVYVLSHLWNDSIFELFEKNKRSERLNDILCKETDRYISQSECGICLENIDKKIYQCCNCGKLVHKSCMNVWFDKSKSNGKRGKCIYCIQ
jgi:hypothetical protein